MTVSGIKLGIHRLNTPIQSKCNEDIYVVMKLTTVVLISLNTGGQPIINFEYEIGYKVKLIPTDTSNPIRY